MHSRKNLSSRVNQRASSPWPSLSAKGEGVSVSERCRRNVTKIVVLTLDCRTNLRDSLQRRRRRRRRPIRRTRPTARTATCACVRAAYHTRDRQRPPPLPHLATRSLCVATAAGGAAHSKTARRFGERTNLEWNWSRVFDPSSMLSKYST